MVFKNLFSTIKKNLCMNFTPLFILYLFVLQSIVQHFIDTECYKPFKRPYKAGTKISLSVHCKVR